MVLVQWLLSMSLWSALLGAVIFALVWWGFHEW